MNRRDFSLGLAAATLGSRGFRSRLLMASPEIDGARLNQMLATLGAIGVNTNQGMDRQAYSDNDLKARQIVLDWMRDAGLSPRIDAAGNIWGRVAGSADLPPIVIGSHIDSVPNGGRYDGPVGSLGAIEVARTIRESGVRLRHPLETVVWQNEEGGLYGSRAVAEGLTETELQDRALSGVNIAEGIRRIGGDPAQLGSVRRPKGSIAGYFELHIEQGGNLDEKGVQIGIVEGIVSIQRWDVRFEGFANHAGTTAMDRRQDALLAAARFIDMVNRVIRAEPGRQVATVGKLEISPGAPNVIPGRVIAVLEMRDLDEKKMARLHEKIDAETQQIAQAANVKANATKMMHHVAALADESMRAHVAEAAKGLRLTTMSLPSGAGHDAQEMAQLGPMGMIFVPSVKGISHAPQEYTKPADIVNGGNVLLQAVLRLDAAR